MVLLGVKKVREREAGDGEDVEEEVAAGAVFEGGVAHGWGVGDCRV